MFCKAVLLFLIAMGLALAVKPGPLVYPGDPDNRDSVCSVVLKKYKAIVTQDEQWPKTLCRTLVGDLLKLDRSDIFRFELADVLGIVDGDPVRQELYDNFGVPMSMKFGQELLDYWGLECCKYPHELMRRSGSKYSVDLSSENCKDQIDIHIASEIMFGSMELKYTAPEIDKYVLYLQKWCRHEQEEVK